MNIRFDSLQHIFCFFFHASISLKHKQPFAVHNHKIATDLTQKHADIAQNIETIDSSVIATNLSTNINIFFFESDYNHLIIYKPHKPHRWLAHTNRTSVTEASFE